MPAPFTRCLVFIIAMASKEFTLTAGKFVAVSRKTMLNVRIMFYFFSVCSPLACESVLDLIFVTIYSELLRIWTLSIVRNSKKLKT
jgi:hypothetical protein